MIHVVKAPEEQAAGTIRARVVWAMSPWVDINSLKYSASATSLSIGDPSTPDQFDDSKRGTACLGISVVVYMAAGAKLENFNIASLHLGMRIYDGVSFLVSNSTSISLTSGALDSSPFNSRETRLETVSGSISGKYTLRDLLSIKTKSGSVDVKVEPDAGVEGGSKSAVFCANSVSGSIRTDFERRRIPVRDYQVTVKTNVGSIDGTFIHGSKTAFDSISGSINADILPLSGSSYASALDTSTKSGDTKLKLRAPYAKSNGLLSKLTSSHKSNSGSLDLTYPREWAGHLVGSTRSGSIHLRGRDLRVTHENEDFPIGSRVEATQGHGDSNMVFQTTSGACNVKVGRLR